MAMLGELVMVVDVVVSVLDVEWYVDVLAIGVLSEDDTGEKVELAAIGSVCVLLLLLLLLEARLLA